MSTFCSACEVQIFFTSLVTDLGVDTCEYLCSWAMARLYPTSSCGTIRDEAVRGAK